MMRLEIRILVILVVCGTVIGISEKPYYTNYTYAYGMSEVGYYNKLKTFNYFTNDVCMAVKCVNSTLNCLALSAPDASDNQVQRYLFRKQRRQRRLYELAMAKRRAQEEAAASDDAASDETTPTEDTTTVQEELVIKLSSSCLLDEKCVVNNEEGDMVGYCTKKSKYIDPEKIYNGLKCDPDWYWKKCAYGPQKCSNYRCKSIEAEEKCSDHLDCPPDKHCGEESLCVEAVGRDQPCIESIQCGRRSMCWYRDIRSEKGVCAMFFTKADGENVGTYLGASLGPLQSYYVLMGEAKLLCKSGYASDDGHCKSALPISQMKGEKCTTDKECITSDPLVFGKCECGFTETGSKYCGLVAGDDEWVTARKDFKTYFDDSQDCHAAAGWDKCDAYSSYYSWKYSEMQAEYYTYTINNDDLMDDCMKLLKNDLPIFDEMEYNRVRAAAHSTHITLIVFFISLLFALLL